ncbi:MAG: DNA repair protein RecO [Burkholderiaceae bacterium]|nr:DNA repair protein RecO [Burkholderiaceae bacterium]
MAPPRRFAHEPAFVLHRHDWSESSLILDVFSRHHGRVVLVAKGAKKPSSNFRPVLLPLQPLHLTWTHSANAAQPGASDIHTLKVAEWAGGHTMPMGDALLAGTYLNELLLRLLGRADPHPALFDAYAGVVRVLASEHGDALEPVLRAFELLLLREIGLLPALDAQTLTLAPLRPQARYALTPEGGLLPAPARARASLSAAQWLALHAALQGTGVRLAALLRSCAPVAFELKPQLRALLQYHCGPPLLRTRQLMMDIQAL